MGLQPTLYQGAGEVHKKEVFLDSASAVKEGEGLCYKRGFTSTEDGEASDDPYEGRDNIVERPSADNADQFAGVASQDYSATSGGQWITIYEPGSICNVRAHVDGSSGLNTLRMTCVARADDAANANNGEFYKPGFPGRGSALCLQEVDRSSTPGLMLAKLEGGPNELGVESGLVEELGTVDNGAMTDPMLTGVTYIFKDKALDGGNSTCTLGDAVLHTRRKDIYVSENPGTNDIDLTVTNHETSSPEHLFLNDGEYAQLEWNELVGNWRELAKTADTS